MVAPNRHHLVAQMGLACQKIGHSLAKSGFAFCQTQAQHHACDQQQRSQYQGQQVEVTHHQYRAGRSQAERGRVVLGLAHGRKRHHGLTSALDGISPAMMGSSSETKLDLPTKSKAPSFLAALRYDSLSCIERNNTLGDLVQVRMVLA